MTTNRLKTQLEQLLFADIERFWLNLYHHKYSVLVDELSNWELIKNKPEHEEQVDWLQLQTIAFLRYKIEQLHDSLRQLQIGHNNFVERFAKADFKAEKELHILTYAKQLGAKGKQLKADKEAFSRWFDEGAVIARYQDRVSDIEQSLKFLISKLGSMTRTYLKSNEATLIDTWKKLDLQPFFLSLLDASNNSHVRHGMIRALVNQVSIITEANVDPDLNSELVAKLVEQLESTDTPYLAVIDICEILIHQRPTFIRSYIWAELDESISMYSDKPKNNSILFIISAFAKIICKQYTINQSDERLLQTLSAHPYPRVRQALIEQTVNMPYEFVTSLLLSRFDKESCDAIKFTLIKQLSATRFCESDFAFKLWEKTICSSQATQLKRIALELSARIMLNMQLYSDEYDSVFKRFIDTLNIALCNEHSIDIKRVITRTREQLASFYQQSLISAIDEQANMHSTVVLPATISQDTLGRVLSFKAQQQLGFNGQIKGKHWHILKGYKFGYRFWRIWHEFFSPSTDKRPSFNHTTAKKPSAQLHVPSCTVAEISETNVPGEALYHLKELSSRPHLPLLDYLLSVLSHDNLPSPTSSYTPDGILETTKPNSLWQRAHAYWYISLNFNTLDGLRKGKKLEQQNYLKKLEKLGFSFKFKAYGQIENAVFPVEPTIKKLFERTNLAIPLFNVWLSFREYIYSIYQNTLPQLVFFTTGFIAYFWGRHIYISKKINDNRNAIPVSIGGWGTRGKSGTERLKSALFSSLALRVITKTTGCEAMMIYTKSSGEQFEIPIYRPFDKASIWEQNDILTFARNVKADIFLWECMGLTPRYVKILRRWMRDNFATITNAYPDHEDILGPTGLDVAREMSAFIGKNTQVFTSEQTMYSVLDQNAVANNSTLIQVHWGDGFQIPPDIRALYPYDEHPDNIALVAKMAQYIGIDKDIVYKETAERIIPDVGVLQHFSGSLLGTIKQSFINSMSANERLATLDNWQRLNLDEKNNLPYIQTIALINNRNDRVARSKVFAHILIDDLTFDYVVIIGSNVDGFFAYAKQVLEDRLIRIANNHDVADLAQLLSQFKLCQSIEQWLVKANVSLTDHPLALVDVSDQETLKKALDLRLSEQPEQKDLLMQHFIQFNQCKLLFDLNKEDITLEALSPLIELFSQKCIILDNPNISPDALTLKIAALACHNYEQLIVGMQNIKGTGLDYVYAWQKFNRTLNTCDKLLSDQVHSSDFKALLLQLAQNAKFGLIEVDYLEQALDRIAAHPFAQNEFSQAEITHIKDKLKRTKVQAYEAQNATKNSGFRAVLLNLVNSFLDAGATVKRKKTAQQVYTDIANQRITIEKAITVLTQLNRS
ncbi:hypothetical protein PSECIP111951_03071 [Pseudoalteromonas holothuriae]|uniref:Poly-gamma-glutamate synthase PgsB n=1 Tax=Pseudoalteromonas holothuriae TaxID=2963714 RepID=A0ABN8UP43_9GAMM|nr:poly-gamma-glutamate synthase PgsB [Pseudoalteromonas sp. CIP111951]CAH9064195.1 hypothetical protein PSECIP111951_03071 [Pseudoalteromonas sp. CIP111951]